ncbi:MAG: hypothetical protein LBG60_15715 [Bifidobacteriaceae bacterium]|jgi:hypothetical protein|nr:hypothetical protein [Bifidobacteriaceae bacterium]
MASTAQFAPRPIRAVVKLGLTAVALTALTVSAGCADPEPRVDLPGATVAPGTRPPTVLLEPSAAEIFKHDEPGSFDADAAEALGLAAKGAPNDLYGAVWVMYRQILSDFLNDALDLPAQDARFAESQLGFEPQSADEASFHQRHSPLGLDFVYLRNNTHVERLSAEDLAVFLNKMSDDGFRSDPALREIVERTYIRVGRIIDDDAVDGSGYDLTGARNCDNDAIAFEISYLVRYDQDGNYVDKQAHIAQDRFARELIEPMASDLTARLGHSVAVFMG